MFVLASPYIHILYIINFRRVAALTPELRHERSALALITSWSGYSADLLGQINGTLTLLLRCRS
jgi:hypothetical protein